MQVQQRRWNPFYLHYSLTKRYNWKHVFTRKQHNLIQNISQIRFVLNENVIKTKTNSKVGPFACGNFYPCTITIIWILSLRCIDKQGLATQSCVLYSYSYFQRPWNLWGNLDCWKEHIKIHVFCTMETSNFRISYLHA